MSLRRRSGIGVSVPQATATDEEGGIGVAQPVTNIATASSVKIIGLRIPQLPFQFLIAGGALDRHGVALILPDARNVVLIPGDHHREGREGQPYKPIPREAQQQRPHNTHRANTTTPATATAPKISATTINWPTTPRPASAARASSPRPITGVAQAGYPKRRMARAARDSMLTPFPPVCS